MSYTYYIGDTQIPTKNIINFEYTNRMTEDNSFIEAGLFTSSASISFVDFKDNNNTYFFMQRIAEGDVYVNKDFITFTRIKTDNTVDCVLCCFDWDYDYNTKVVKVTLNDYTYNWRNVKSSEVIYTTNTSSVESGEIKKSMVNQTDIDYTYKYTIENKSSLSDFFNSLVNATYKLFNLSAISDKFSKNYISELNDNQMRFIESIANTDEYNSSYLNCNTLFDIWDYFCKTTLCCMYVNNRGFIEFIFLNERLIDSSKDSFKEINKNDLINMDVNISSSTILTNVNANVLGDTKINLSSEINYTRKANLSDDVVEFSEDIANSLIPSFIENRVIYGPIYTNYGNYVLPGYRIDSDDIFKGVLGAYSTTFRYFILCKGQIRLSTPYLDLNTIKNNSQLSYSLSAYLKEDPTTPYFEFDYRNKVNLHTNSDTVIYNVERQNISVRKPYFVLGYAPSSSFYSLLSRTSSNNSKYAETPYLYIENADGVKKNSFIFTQITEDGENSEDLFTLAPYEPIVTKEYQVEGHYGDDILNPKMLENVNLVGGLIFCKSSTKIADDDTYEYISEDSIIGIKSNPTKTDSNEYLYDVIYFCPSVLVDSTHLLTNDFNIETNFYYKPIPLATNLRADADPGIPHSYSLSEGSSVTFSLNLEFTEKRGSNSTRPLFNEDDVKINNKIVNNTIDINNSTSMFDKNQDINKLQKLIYQWYSNGNMIVRLTSTQSIDVSDIVKLDDFDKFFRVTSKMYTLSNYYEYNLVEIFKKDLDYTHTHTYFDVSATEGKSEATINVSISSVKNSHFLVDWGDGTCDINYSNDILFNHIYKELGQYRITIYTSDFYRFNTPTSLLGDNITINDQFLSQYSVSGDFATASDVAEGYYIFNESGERIYGTGDVFETQQMGPYLASALQVKAGKAFYNDRNLTQIRIGNVRTYGGE